MLCVSVCAHRISRERDEMVECVEVDLATAVFGRLDVLDDLGQLLILAVDRSPTDVVLCTSTHASNSSTHSRKVRD